MRHVATFEIESVIRCTTMYGGWSPTCTMLLPMPSGQSEHKMLTWRRRKWSGVKHLDSAIKAHLLPRELILSNIPAINQTPRDSESGMAHAVARP
jgi:hypothetical protein